MLRRRPLHIPGLDALREGIRGAQDLAIDRLQDDIRGGTQEFASGPVVFWNFIFTTVFLPLGVSRILAIGQKPVEFLRFESLPRNTAEILIGYEGVSSGVNAITDLLPGQAITFEMETDDFSRNHFLDASSFFAFSGGLTQPLLVTLGYRDQRAQL